MQNHPRILFPVRILTGCFLLLICSGPALADQSQAEVRENVHSLIRDNGCVGCNLREADLNRLDLAGADLRDADLRGASLFLTNLSDADLRGANLRGARFGGADLANADLRGADLRGAVLAGAYTVGARMDGTLEQRAADDEPAAAPATRQVFVPDDEKPKEVVAQEPAVVTGTKETRRDGAGTDGAGHSSESATKAELIETAPSSPPSSPEAPPEKKAIVPPPVIMGQESGELQEPVTSGQEQPLSTREPRPEIGEHQVETTTAVEAVSTDAEQQGDSAGDQGTAGSAEVQIPPETTETITAMAKLLDTKRCYGCDLAGADLKGKNLRGFDLEGSELRGADLEKANLRSANLKNVSLINANLRGADLRRADLYKADLSGADLTGASLADAKIDEADFSGTIGYQPESSAP